MPNLKETFQQDSKKSFLILGQSGSGKTTQLLTLPGKKFLFAFDPNALQSLQGADIDYEEYLPEKLDVVASSLAKKSQRQGSPVRAYEKFEKDFERYRQQSLFNKYDIIAIDSFTTLSDLVMDQILAINGRPGQWPNLDDYGPQMLVLTKIIRALTSLQKTIYITGHVELKQDENTSRIVNEPLMTGRLKSKLPLLFSDILIASAETDMKGNTKYTMQTRPDRLTQVARSSLREIPYKIDVTIDFSKDLETQGLGGIYYPKQG